MIPYEGAPWGPVKVFALERKSLVPIVVVLRLRKMPSRRHAKRPFRVCPKSPEYDGSDATAQQTHKHTKECTKKPVRERAVPLSCLLLSEKASRSGNHACEPVQLKQSHCTSAHNTRQREANKGSDRVQPIAGVRRVRHKHPWDGKDAGVEEGQDGGDAHDDLVQRARLRPLAHKPPRMNKHCAHLKEVETPDKVVALVDEDDNGAQHQGNGHMVHDQEPVLVQEGAHRGNGHGILFDTTVPKNPPHCHHIHQHVRNSNGRVDGDQRRVPVDEVSRALGGRRNPKPDPCRRNSLYQ